MEKESCTVLIPYVDVELVMDELKIDRQIDRQIDELIDRKIDRQIEELIDR